MEIKRFTLGITNSYLLQGNEGYVMIDAGNFNQQKRFLRVLDSLGIKPGQIKLIIITHAHFDHVGSLAAIKALCNCPVLIHAEEKELISKPVVVIPPGTNLTGKIISLIGNLSKPILKFAPAQPEIIIDDKFDLDHFGIDAKVIHTPGHTKGSLTVLSADGQAIVGDLAVNYRVGVFPPFAEEPEKIFAAWDMLLKSGVNQIYPAHGEPFPAQKLAEEYNKYMRKRSK